MLTRELDAIDRTCSRFRQDSELVRMNAASGDEVHVSPLLFDALRTAVDAARASAGLVDPTIGRTLRLAGYDATFSVVRSRNGRLVRPSFVRDPDWRTVELDETSNRPHAGGRRARPRRDREGVRSRPRSEPCTRGDGHRRAHLARRRYRGCRRSSSRRLVGAHRRGQCVAARQARRHRGHLDRRPGDIGDDRAQMGEQRRPSSSHHRSSNRACRERALAHGDRRSSIVRRCQHGEHRGDHSRRTSAGVARRVTAACAAHALRPAGRFSSQAGRRRAAA